MQEAVTSSVGVGNIGAHQMGEEKSNSVKILIKHKKGMVTMGQAISEGPRRSPS